MPHMRAPQPAAPQLKRKPGRQESQGWGCAVGARRRPQPRVLPCPQGLAHDAPVPHPLSLLSLNPIGAGDLPDLHGHARTHALPPGQQPPPHQRGGSPAPPPVAVATRGAAAAAAPAPPLALDAPLLTHLITSARSASDLSRLYQQHGGSFNAVHTAAALTRLAKLPPSGAGPSAASLALRLFAHLVSNLHTCSCARQAANAVWALGRLQVVPPAPLLAAAAVRLLADGRRLLRSANAQEVANLAWGLARLEVPGAHPLWQAVAHAAVVRADSLKPQEVANLLWALARVRQYGGDGAAAAATGRLWGHGVGGGGGAARGGGAAEALAAEQELEGQGRSAEQLAGSWRLARALRQRWHSPQQQQEEEAAAAAAAQHKQQVRDAERRGSHAAASTRSAASSSSNVAAAAAGAAAAAAAAEGRELHAQLLDGCSRAIYRRLGSWGFKPQELANVMWALAVLGHRDEQLLGSVSRQLRKQLSWCNPQDLANALWALARSGVADPAMFAAAGCVLPTLLPACTDQELAMMVAAAAEACEVGGALWTEALRELRARLPRMGAAEAAVAAHACGVAVRAAAQRHAQQRQQQLQQQQQRWQRAGLAQAPNHLQQRQPPPGSLAPDAAAFLSATAGRLPLLGPRLAPRELAMLLGALAAASLPLPPAPAAAAAAALRASLPHLDAPTLAVATWACARLRLPLGALPGGPAAPPQLASASPQELSMLAWAAATSGTADALLFDGLARAAALRLREFKPQALAVTMWSLARAGHYDGALVRGIAAAAERQLHLFRAQELANLLWGMTKLKYLQVRLFDAAADEVVRRCALSGRYVAQGASTTSGGAVQRWQQEGQGQKQQQHNALDAPAMAKLAVAFTAAGAPRPLVMNALGDALAARQGLALAALTPHALCELVGAYAGAEQRHTGLCAAACAEAARRVAALAPKDAVALLGALAALRHKDGPLLDALAARVAADTGLRLVEPAPLARAGRGGTPGAAAGTATGGGGERAGVFSGGGSLSSGSAAGGRQLAGGDDGQLELGGRWKLWHFERLALAYAAFGHAAAHGFAAHAAALAPQQAPLQQSGNPGEGGQRQEPPPQRQEPLPHQQEMQGWQQVQQPFGAHPPPQKRTHTLQVQLQPGGSQGTIAAAVPLQRPPQRSAAAARAVAGADGPAQARGANVAAAGRDAAASRAPFRDEESLKLRPSSTTSTSNSTSCGNGDKSRSSGSGGDGSCDGNSSDSGCDGNSSDSGLLGSHVGGAAPGSGRDNASGHGEHGSPGSHGSSHGSHGHDRGGSSTRLHSSSAAHRAAVVAGL